MDSISIIGLGRLGLPIAAVYASAGYRVYGIDLRSRISWLKKHIQKGLYEPYLDQMLSKYSDKIIFSSNYREAILHTDISIIVVPTPSKKDGEFSLKYVMQVIDNLGKALKQKKKYHLIVITSTIMPLSMDAVIMPYLKKLTGKHVGSNLGLCYSPELIALGSVIKNLVYPDLIIIGELDNRAGSLFSQVRTSVCKNSPRVIRINFINAEVAKLALNSYITTKISFANMIARICEKIPGADVDIVTSTIGSDSRIGNKYLTGGLGYGGPCFPRDNLAINQFIKSLNSDMKLPLTIHQFNQNQVKTLKEIVLKFYKKNNIIGVLGLSYKPNTNVIEESQSILLIKELLKNNLKIIAYDPIAIPHTKLVLEDKIDYARSTEDCIIRSDIIVVTTPWNEFKTIQKFELSKKIIIDCWRIVNTQKNKKFKYIPLGQYIK